MSDPLLEQQKLANELELILSEISEESLAEMDYDRVIDLRKKLNPYGRTVEGSDNYLTFSFTNLSEKYMEKLIMTALIGYLNRSCDEWHVPDGIPIVPVYDYMENPSILTDKFKDWKIHEQLQKDIDENNEWMQKRMVVKQFLEEMFQFNPDVHVRSSYKPKPKDISRRIIDTPAANVAINDLKRKDITFREEMLEFDRIQNVRDMMEGKDEKIDPLIDDLVGKKLLLPEFHYSTMDFDKWSPEDRNALRAACEMIPPSDIFRKYRNYMEDNYDKLREAVLYLYCDKPDFDIAINPYSWHENEEEAEEFQKKHKDEVITDIIKAHSGKWNFFAPFSKVKDSTKFFNKDTMILEEIAGQIERDAKIGADMMKKKIVVKKQKNIKREGPDAEAFRKWKAQNEVLKEMGAVNPNQENDAIDECPKDAVEVGIWKFSEGGLKVEKSKMYTQAEIPTICSEYK